ncbi:MAG: alpha/beta hydrolase, partial [Actinomycetota bacterium]
MPEVRTDAARNGDVRIHFDAFGDPTDPTLLLVNGLGSQCVNYQDAWCEMFAAEGLQVVRYDNRDVGLSSHLPEAEYT